jgi:hypothetical protein
MTGGQDPNWAVALCIITTTTTIISTTITTPPPLPPAAAALPPPPPPPPPLRFLVSQSTVQHSARNLFFVAVVWK